MHKRHIERTMQRGLITIATGNIKYYEIAANLLLSYRYFSKEPLPFAIIAEEENEYTDLFDDVILTTEAKHSFMDKFLLLKLTPYEESIFFDADSLAYGDLNEYWDFFENATDFSATGQNFSLDEEGAWYDLEGIGEYGSKIQYKTRVHAGVCYIRRSETLKKMYQDCMELEENYDKLYFHTCPHSKDECILGIAMPMNGMKAIEEKVDMLATYPCLIRVHADMLNKELSYTTMWGTSSSKGILVHWGTAQTYGALYRYNVECLHLLMQCKQESMSIKDKILYQYRVRLLYLNIICFFKNFAKKIRIVVKNLIKY